MREIFAISYGLLCALLLLQGFVLYVALRRAARLSRLYSIMEHRQKQEAAINPPWYLPVGTRLPEFAAPVLATNRILTDADLRGHEIILLFVSPADASSHARHQNYDQIGPAFISMWERVKGEVYLVCRGNQQDCERLVDGSHAKAIWDETGVLFSSFSIDRTPRAVELDEQMTVTRYGEPDNVRNLMRIPFHAGDREDTYEGSSDEDAVEVAHHARNGVGHG
jgi:hypothetical protein